MELLGSRLRQRRRQMKFRQRDVASENSASFLSKVEKGVAQPSLKNLRDWSNALQTTSADLLGDHLILEAAKQSILLMEKCHSYLDRLQLSPLTVFLRDLSTSANALSISVPEPPPDPELEYLTAKVLLHRGMILEAEEMSKRSLSRSYSPLLRISHLSLLCLIYQELAEPIKERQTKANLRQVILELDYNMLLHILPEADVLSADDLELLRLSALFKNTAFL